MESKVVESSRQHEGWEDRRPAERSARSVLCASSPSTGLMLVPECAQEVDATNVNASASCAVLTGAAKSLLLALAPGARLMRIDLTSCSEGRKSVARDIFQISPLRGQQLPWMHIAVCEVRLSDDREAPLELILWTSSHSRSIYASAMDPSEERGVPVVQIASSEFRITCFEVIDGSNTLLMGDAGRDVAVIEIPSGTRVACMRHPEMEPVVISGVLHEGFFLVATGCYDGCVRLYRVDLKAESPLFEERGMFRCGKAGVPTCFKFVDGRYLVVGTDSGHVIVLEICIDRPKIFAVWEHCDVEDVVLQVNAMWLNSPDASIATASADGSVHVYELLTGKLRAKQRLKAPALAVGCDGSNHFFACDAAGHFKVWQVRTSIRRTLVDSPTSVPSFEPIPRVSAPTPEHPPIPAIATCSQLGIVERPTTTTSIDSASEGDLLPRSCVEVEPTPRPQQATKASNDEPCASPTKGVSPVADRQAARSNNCTNEQVHAPQADGVQDEGRRVPLVSVGKFTGPRRFNSILESEKQSIESSDLSGLAQPALNSSKWIQHRIEELEKSQAVPTEEDDTALAMAATTAANKRRDEKLWQDLPGVDVDEAELASKLRPRLVCKQLDPRWLDARSVKPDVMQLMSEDFLYPQVSSKNQVSVDILSLWPMPEIEPMVTPTGGVRQWM